MGGKSSSSNKSSQETNSQSASGVVGDVVQGQSVTINQELPDNAVDVFKQLVGLVGQSLDLVEEAGGAALESSQSAIEKVSDRTTQATQPDLSLSLASIKNMPIIAGLAAVVAGIYFWRKK